VGRLPALIVALFCLTASAVGCDQTKKDAPTAPRERSQAVAGTGEPAATVTAAQSATRPIAKRTSRKLCDGQLSKPGRPLPASAISRAAAPGTPEPAGDIPVSGGKWTWINFWAAWCVPCKEEMPRLLGWEKQLPKDGGRMRLVFVTLDDDPRQLKEFLAAQPATGVRSTFWLREGKEREDWFKAIDIEDEPELPAHLLVDPSGKVRCTVLGAVEDRDYEQVVALVGR
jgi:thiol-disulfide isomerase/thioredoxin